MRLATLTDSWELAEIGIDAWRWAYGHFLEPHVLHGLHIVNQAARWAERIPGKRPTFVLEDGGVILGYVVVGFEKPDNIQRGEVFAIYLRPEQTGKGLGRVLMRRAVSYLLELGCEDAVVWSFKSNDRAIAFYTGLGAEYVQEAALNISGTDYPEVQYRWPSVEALAERLGGPDVGQDGIDLQ